MDILELMFIMYMHDFWVNTKCCQGKQYKVQIPQQNEFFQGMMTGEKEVEDYRENVSMYHWRYARKLFLRAT